MATAVTGCNRPTAAPTAAIGGSPVAPENLVHSTVQVLPTPTRDPSLPQIFHDLAMHPTDAAEMWLTFGNFATRSTDFGFSWQPQTSSVVEGANILHVEVADDGRLLLAGIGVLQFSDDGGLTWSRHPDLGTADVRGLATDPGSPDQLYAIVEDRGLLHSADAGDAWTTVDTDLPAGAFGLWIARAEPLRLLTIDRAQPAVMASDDRGATWRVLEASGLTASALGMALASDGALYAVTDDGLFRSDDAGETWEKVADRKLPVAVAVSPDDPAEITVVNQKGEVLRSPDRGATWGE
jgi:photosystem II stability/assembly factor-like uncharacterized protein